MATATTQRLASRINIIRFLSNTSDVILCIHTFKFRNQSLFVRSDCPKRIGVNFLSTGCSVRVHVKTRHYFHPPFRPPTNRSPCDNHFLTVNGRWRRQNQRILSTTLGLRRGIGVGHDESSRFGAKRVRYGLQRKRWFLITFFVQFKTFGRALATFLPSHRSYLFINFFFFIEGLIKN